MLGGKAIWIAVSRSPGADDGVTIFCPTSSWAACRISRTFWAFSSSTSGRATRTGARRFFFANRKTAPAGPPDPTPARSHSRQLHGDDLLCGPYVAMMIDHGFCFNAGEWDFPDAPLRGLYARHRVYQGVAGMEAFEPWLDRLDKHMTESVLGEEAEPHSPGVVRRRLGGARATDRAPLRPPQARARTDSVGPEFRPRSVSKLEGDCEGDTCLTKPCNPARITWCATSPI